MKVMVVDTHYHILSREISRKSTTDFFTQIEISTAAEQRFTLCARELRKKQWLGQLCNESAPIFSVRR